MLPRDWLVAMVTALQAEVPGAEVKKVTLGCCKIGDSAIFPHTQPSFFVWNLVSVPLLG